MGGSTPLILCLRCTRSPARGLSIAQAAKDLPLLTCKHVPCIQQNACAGKSVVAMAVMVYADVPFAVKFFPVAAQFKAELAVRKTPLGAFTPQIYLTHDPAGSDANRVGTRDSYGRQLPPCIVMARGESLQAWLDRAETDRFQAVTVRAARGMASAVSCACCTGQLRNHAGLLDACFHRACLPAKHGVRGKQRLRGMHARSVPSIFLRFFGTWGMHCRCLRTSQRPFEAYTQKNSSTATSSPRTSCTCARTTDGRSPTLTAPPPSAAVCPLLPRWITRLQRTCLPQPRGPRWCGLAPPLTAGRSALWPLSS